MLNYTRQFSLGLNQPHYLPPPNPPVNLPAEPPLVRRRTGKRSTGKPSIMEPPLVKSTTVKPPLMKPPLVKPTTVPFSRVINLLYNDHLSMELSPPGFISSAKPSVFEILEVLSLLEKDQSDTIKNRASKFLRGLIKYDLFQTLMHDPKHLDILLRGGILILKETSVTKISESTKQYIIAIFMDLSKDDKLRALIITHRLRQELIDSLLLHLEDPPSFPTTLATKDSICELFRNLVYEQDNFKKELQQLYGQRLNVVWAHMLLQILCPDTNLSNDEQTCLQNICEFLHYLNIDQDDNQPLLVYKYKSGESTKSVELTTSEVLEILGLLKKDHSDMIKLQASIVLRGADNESAFQTLMRHPEHLDTLLTGGILILKETSLAKISELTKRYVIALFMDLSVDNKLRALITTHRLRHELIDSLLFNLEDPPSFPTTLNTKDAIRRLLRNLVYEQAGFKKELRQVYGQRLNAIWVNMLLQWLLPDHHLSNDEKTCLKSICEFLRRYSNINQHGNQPLLVYKSEELTESIELTTFEVLEILGLLKKDQPDTIKLRASIILMGLAREPTFPTLLQHPEHLDTLITGGILILKETSLAKISELTKQYMITNLANLCKDDKLQALITTHRLRYELFDSLLLNLEDSPSFPTTLKTKNFISILLYNLVYKQDSFKKELQQVYGQRMNAVWANMLLQWLLPNHHLSNDEKTCLKSICSHFGSLNIDQNDNQPLLVFEYKSGEFTKYERPMTSVKLMTSAVLTILGLLKKDQSDTIKLRASIILKGAASELPFQELLEHPEHLDTLLTGGILILKETSLAKISELTKQHIIWILTDLSTRYPLRTLITTHRLRHELIDSLLLHLEDPPSFPTTLETKRDICVLFSTLAFDLFNQSDFKKELQQVYGQRLNAILTNMLLQSLVPNHHLSDDEQTCLKSICSRLRSLNINHNNNQPLFVYEYKSGELTKSIEFTTFEFLEIVGLLKKDQSDMIKLWALKSLKVLFSQSFQSLLYDPEHLGSLLSGWILILKEPSRDKISECPKQDMIKIFIDISIDEVLGTFIIRHRLRYELIDSLLLNLEDSPSFPTTLATKDSICELLHNLVLSQYCFKVEIQQVYGQRLINTLLNMLQALLPVLNNDQQTCIEHIIEHVCLLLYSWNQDFNQQLYAYQKVPILKMLLTLLNPKNTAKLTDSTRLTVYKLLGNLVFSYDPFLEDIVHQYNSLTTQAIVTILNEYDQSPCKLSLAQKVTVLLSHLLNNSSFRKHLTPADFQELKTTLSNILATEQYPQFKKMLTPILQLLEEKQDVNFLTRFLTFFNFFSKPSEEAAEPSREATENKQLSAPQ